MSTTPPTRARNPLKEIPSSLSNRSPVSTNSIPSSRKVDINNANSFLEFPDEKENKADPATDKYSSIATLDDQLDDVKWLERNSIITSIDHMHNLDAASKIIESIIDTVINLSTPHSWVDCVSTPTPAVSEVKDTLSTNILKETLFPTNSSVDTSFSSVIDAKESDSEYESAVESIVSETVTDLMDKVLDNVGIGEDEDANIMDIIRNGMDFDHQDTTITCTSPNKDDDIIEDSVTPVVKSNQFQF